VDKGVRRIGRALVDKSVLVEDGLGGSGGLKLDRSGALRAVLLDWRSCMDCGMAVGRSW
jgi:hypothetical protein